jgi:hypothetical protein
MPRRTFFLRGWWWPGWLEAEGAVATIFFYYRRTSSMISGYRHRIDETVWRFHEKICYKVLDEVVS